jgi:3-hydroxymyristoyl/3-hydroxydecanoyl-(acyl carrier protein) dehydratase
VPLFPDAGFERRATAPAEEHTGARYVLADTSRCFDGHFDEAPVLPGVAQIGLVLETCAAEPGAGSRGGLTALRDVRFTRALRPGDEVDVVLAPGPTPDSRRFELRSGGALVSTGVVVFSRDAATGPDAG